MADLHSILHRNLKGLLPGLEPRPDVTGRARARGLMAVRLRPDELKVRWADLAGADAPKAHRAVWALVAASGQAVPFLAERLRPAAAPDARRLARLIRDLDNNDFVVRQKSAAELEKLGAAAGPALRRALAGGPAPEARRQIEALLERLQSWVPERLRPHRALQVLEQTGTAAARRVVKQFAREATDEALAREARDTLARMARRAGGTP